MHGLTKDGEVIWQENARTEEYMTGAEAEALAAADPDHDWRISLMGPLREREYQRHEDGAWVLVKTGDGFA